MNFNSEIFALFLIVVLLLYLFIFNKTAKSQNVLLLMASLFFYGWADWRFLFLVVGNAVLNYFIGIKISKSEEEKFKLRYLWLGISINLGVLGFFKYFNFFYDNFIDVFNLFGLHLNHSSLIIILPLGISFFTFQTLGYIIDIYNEEIEPTHDLLNFSTYVLYFPKLLAGPIERAQKFLPQIETKRVFDYNLTVDGFRQILWGLFTKVVIADNCATFVNATFNNYQNHSSALLLAGLFFYLIQIYSDFAGYSNIAIGVSKLFGIKLMKNFETPFFSTNISDFWKKWHISLTSWLMDYVFTPLSFLLRKFKKKGLFLSILTTFILVGFWHGAKWTFIVFGVIQGLYFLPMVIRGSINSNSAIDKHKLFPSFIELLQMIGMFILLMLTVVFFRADNSADAILYLSSIFKTDLFSGLGLMKSVWYLPWILLFAEWFQRDKEHALQLYKTPVFIRWAIYYTLIYSILNFAGGEETFIYFQF